MAAQNDKRKCFSAFRRRGYNVRHFHEVQSPIMECIDSSRVMCCISSKCIPKFEKTKPTGRVTLSWRAFANKCLYIRKKLPHSAFCSFRKWLNSIFENRVDNEVTANDEGYKHLLFVAATDKYCINNIFPTDTISCHSLLQIIRHLLEKTPFPTSRYDDVNWHFDYFELFALRDLCGKMVKEWF